MTFSFVVKRIGGETALCRGFGGVLRSVVGGLAVWARRSTASFVKRRIMKTERDLSLIPGTSAEKSVKAHEERSLER